MSFFRKPGVLPDRNRWSILFFLVLALSWSVIRLCGSPGQLSSNLHLSATAGSTGTFQVFWAGPDQEYGEKRSARVFLRPDRQQYRLAIPPLHEIERLRIDPIDQAAEITLHEIRLEPQDGHDLVFASAEEFSKFTPLYDIQGMTVDGDGLKIIAGGTDPQVELEIHRPGRQQYVWKHLLTALLYGMIMASLFRLLHRDRYQYYAGSPVSDSYAVHILWMGTAWAAGMFLVAVTPFALPQEKRLLFFLSLSVVAGASLYLAFFYLATRPDSTGTGRASRTVAPLAWLKYALPCYAVWPLYLLAFWPGSLSPDSMDQWREVLSGHFTDWNPAFHTMTIWLVTRAWLSPAMAILSQIAALGAVAGWSLSVLERYGVPRCVLWLTCLVFALLPVNGLMAVTLWKDIAYSTALLALTTLLFHMVMSRGQWLDRPRSWLWLGLVIFLVAIYRHNGIVPAFATPLLLLFLYRRHWGKILSSAMVGLVLLVVVRGPVYEILDVRRGTPMDYVYASVSGQVRALADKFSGEEKPQKAPSEMSASGEIKKSSPNPLTERLNSSSRLWRIYPLQNFHRRIEYVNVWIKFKGKEPYIKYISGKTPGVTEEPVLPGVQQKIFAVFQRSIGGFWFFIWRPAVFLYAFLFCTAVAAYRIGSGKLLLLTAPVLLNSLPTLFIVIHKSIFRYHYGIVIVSLVFSFSLLFLDRGLYRSDKRG
jgi:hypothetical protein